MRNINRSFSPSESFIIGLLEQNFLSYKIENLHPLKIILPYKDFEKFSKLIKEKLDTYTASYLPFTSSNTENLDFNINYKNNSASLKEIEIVIGREKIIVKLDTFSLIKDKITSFLSDLFSK